MPPCDQEHAMVIYREPKPVHLQDNGLLSVEHTPEHLIAITSVRSNSDSPLLSLPAEIRHKIFEFALGGNTIFCAVADEANFCLTDLATGNPCLYVGDTEHALLRVCRQVYSETALLPYSTNVFEFNSRQALTDTCAKMVAAQREAVTSVVVDKHVVRLVPFGGWTKSTLTSERELRLWFPNLTRLVFKEREVRQNLRLVEFFSDWVRRLRRQRGELVVQAMKTAGKHARLSVRGTKTQSPTSEGR